MAWNKPRFRLDLCRTRGRDTKELPTGLASTPKSDGHANGGNGAISKDPSNCLCQCQWSRDLSGSRQLAATRCFETATNPIVAAGNAKATGRWRGPRQGYCQAIGSKPGNSTGGGCQLLSYACRFGARATESGGLAFRFSGSWRFGFFRLGGGHFSAFGGRGWIGFSLGGGGSFGRWSQDGGGSITFRGSGGWLA